ILGWVQTDLKKILAYTTLSILGMLALLMGVGSPEALKAAVLVMLGHACYKAGLFMAAGAVDKATGTRDLRRLGGLRTTLPVLGVSSIVLALSKSGFPPLLGFVGKEYAYKFGFMGNQAAHALLVFLFIINLGLMALALRVALTPFLGDSRSVPGEIKNPGPLMLTGPVVLAVAGIVLGLLSPTLLTPVVGAAVSHIHGTDVELTIKLWHGLSPAFLLSLATLAAGWWLYRYAPATGTSNRFSNALASVETLYQLSYRALMDGSAAITARLQNGDLRSYLRWFFITVLALVAAKWRMSGFPVVSLPETDLPPPWIEWAMLPAIAVFLWLIVTTNSRILALLSLAVIGLGISFVFARLGAPDVALTLLLVETFTVILFMRLVGGLPRLRVISTRRERLADIAIAGAMGVMMALLALKVAVVQTHPSVSATLAEWSYPLAKGKNIVNVILVDFRALDTLGEITVVTLAAVGARLLWKRARTPQETATNRQSP
ncbi:MAG: hydrogen gas-evolving membrane-bound hydrogenase subunit E, partial [Verrucomicrobiota bacterium JB025]|nr:proton-conducting transporter membrane subunit [Verrucomicrobiota bacterium JB025]